MIQPGYILIFGIILLPFYLLILASALGKPRNARMTGVFYSVLIFGLIIMVVSFFIISAILSPFVPIK